MPIPYFNGLFWNDLTREERFYCFVLYLNARSDPPDFARWLSQSAHLDINLEGQWDLGVEVCLYRDFLWHNDEIIHKSDFSAKRTFDLCLFGSKDIIIIEAKVFEQFGAKQNAAFLQDSKKIPKLLHTTEVKVSLVALASSKYFVNLRKFGNGEVLKPFDGHISWAETYQKFGDKLLKQADDLYRSSTRKLK